jgi:hypothetical protein
VYERALSSTSSPSRIGSVPSERVRRVPPNNAFAALQIEGCAVQVIG